MRPRLRWTALLVLALLAAVMLPGATSATTLPDISVIPNARSPERAAILAPSPPDNEELAGLLAPAPSPPDGEELAGLFAPDGVWGLPPAPEAAVVPVALAPPPAPPPLRPSLFEGAQVVSFYGYPGFPVMGALGAYDPDGAIAEVARVAAEYDAANGERAVLPALHLIVAVAQRLPGSDGLYLERIGDEQLDAYIEAARRHDVLLFLDIQVGWSDALLEVERLTHALREPFVHLALDPEFATRGRRLPPGVAIGSLDAAQVNAVQAYLGQLVRTFDLPPKLLVLHQFLDEMLVETDAYDDVPEVELTIDMDGFGSGAAKLSKYERFALSSYAERAAIKLFYDWDVPLISPARLLALDNPPDLIIYQ